MINNLLAQNSIPLGPIRGFGTLGNPTDSGIGTFAKFISSTIGLMTIIAIIWFIFNFFIGAIGIISAGGDKNALETAKKKITTGVIGFVVVVSAIFIIQLIGFLLGIGNILSLSDFYAKIQIK